ncbi:MAG: V-type ATP synthase subunit D [Candidatus Micrarchaeota archaeon]
MATDVIPTRMELLKTKERIALANKGHKLLKQKRDALILEFFKILKKAQDLRGELSIRLGKAYHSLSLAQIYHNNYEIQNVALTTKKNIDLDMDVKNIMGVKIPHIEATIETPTQAVNLSSIAFTSAKIDQATTDFESVLELIIKLAETETAIKRLIVEIEKTKRRVNALEFVLIPRLQDQRRMIVFRLDEMERDSFVSLKVIKKRLEADKN